MLPVFSRLSYFVKKKMKENKSKLNKDEEVRDEQANLRKMEDYESPVRQFYEIKEKETSFRQNSTKIYIWESTSAK